MHIRLASPEDAAAIAALLKESFPARMWPYMSITQSGSSGYIAQLLRLPFGASDTVTYVAQSAGGICGMAQFRGEESSPAFLSYICVDSRSRRQGVATRLIDAFVERMAPTSITLDVFIENSGARRFYEGLGYVPVGVSHWEVQRLPPAGESAQPLKVRDYHVSAAALEAYGFCEVAALWAGHPISIGRMGRRVGRVREPHLYASAPFLAALAETFSEVQEVLHISFEEGIVDASADFEPVAGELLQTSVRLTKWVNTEARES